MNPILKWTTADRSHRETANVGALLWLAVSPCEVRQEWDWRVDTYDGRLIGEGTDDGRGVEHAKTQAEAFARQWIAAQATALGDGWISAEERLPEEHGEALVVAVDQDEYVFRAVADFYPPTKLWEVYSMLSSVNVTHWRPLPPLPVAEVKE